MAEHKKISLNTIGATKKDSKSEKICKTVRFALALSESNEKTCPEFNYKELLAADNRRAAKNAAALAAAAANCPTNGVSLMDVEEEDESKLREIARKFEQKYGCGGANIKKKKKTERGEEYVDLGAGYDESDSFIDNTDAYDEIVPEEMTTAQGGFYINCGALEYKQLEFSEAHSDGDEAIRSRKRIKRAIVSSDEDSGDEVKPVAKISKPSEEDSGESESSKKLKRPLETPSSLISKKKSATVKDLLKEKREQLGVPIKEGAATLVIPPFKPTATACSIIDTIESVVSAGMQLDGSPMPKVSAPRPVNQNNEREKMEKERCLTTKLPDSVPQEMRTIAESLRTAAIQSENNQSKFFGNIVNRLLIKLEHMTREHPARNEVFAYIAEKLTCTWEVLIKRARRIAQSREKIRSREPLRKLKAAIEQMAPTVLEVHAKECQIYHENRAAENHLGESAKPLTPPRQIFPWTIETRTLLGEVLSIVPTIEENKDLRAFLEEQVRPLWPSGWMTTSNLLREAQSYMRQALSKKSVNLTSKLNRKSSRRPKEPTPVVAAPMVVASPTSSPTSKVSPSTTTVPRATSVITLAEPRLPEGITLTPTTTTPTVPRTSPLSLKQRILQDAVGGAFDPAAKAIIQPNQSTKPNSFDGASIKVLEDGGLWQTKVSPGKMSPPLIIQSNEIEIVKTDQVKVNKVHSSSTSSRDREKLVSRKDEHLSDTKLRESKSSKQHSNNNKSEMLHKTKDSSNRSEVTKHVKNSTSKKQIAETRIERSEIQSINTNNLLVDKDEMTGAEMEANLHEETVARNNINMIDETAAATDFLSQIIHQSLSGFPNASNFSINTGETRNHSISNRSIAIESPKSIPEKEIEKITYHTDERAPVEEVILPFEDSAWGYKKSSPEVIKSTEKGNYRDEGRSRLEEIKHPLEDASWTRKGSISPRDTPPSTSNVKEVRNSIGETSARTQPLESKGKDKLKQEPPALDPELSVQLEMKRVMQELMELNGLSSESPKVSSVQERVRSKPEKQRESPTQQQVHLSPESHVLSSSLHLGSVEKPRSRVDKARHMSNSGSMHIGSNSQISITPTHMNSTSSTSQFNSQQRSVSPTDLSRSVLDKARSSSGVSVIAVNSGARTTQVPSNSFGFQEEFQRHLMQEPDVVFIGSHSPTVFHPGQAAGLGSLYSNLNQQQMPTTVSAEDLRTLSLYSYAQNQANQHLLLNQQQTPAHQRGHPHYSGHGQHRPK